ncbi:MAG: TolB family protein, partial [Candidatus Rokuibacteriota bacterium]
MRWLVAGALVALGLAGATACSASGENTEGGRPDPAAEREQDGSRPVLEGGPIDVAGLEGRIVFDDFEDVFVMDADGTGVRPLADRPGPEFDGAWSPDGRRIVYRDSRRGINENDEVYVARADGSGARNLTRDPAND